MSLERENVTLSLPADVLRAARHLAVDQGISLSRFVARLVEEQVVSTTNSEREKVSALRELRQGYAYTVPGKITWTRDDLHDRVP